MTALFVAGAHTDVGKTHVACALLAAARAAGRSVGAFKPVVSGFDAADWAMSDPGRLLTALGIAHSATALASMTEWVFEAPLAPPMAARLEGRSLTIAEIARACEARLRSVDLYLVEGAGGVMSPLADDGTCLDLMRRLGLPALLVGGAYLGGISHALTALETLRAHQIPVAALVVSGAAERDAPDFAETVTLVARYAGGVPVLPAPRTDDQAWTPRLLDRLLADGPGAMD